MKDSGTEKIMGMDVYNAVVNDLFEDIKRADIDDVFRKTHEENNILHLAAMYEHHEFAISVLKLYPHLTSKKNSHGNTPLHIIAQMSTSVNVVREFCNRCDPSHWKIQNSAGNTPLHVALIHDNLDIARLLMDRDLDLALIVNHSDEAPLHLVFQHYIAANFYDIKSIKDGLKHIDDKENYSMTDNESTSLEGMLSLMNLFLEKETCVACLRDSSGLTPLLRAVSLTTPYNIRAIETILEHCPMAVEVCDYSGKTILHHLVSKLSSYEEAKKLITDNVAMYSLRHHQDQQGNTALHLAAINKDVVMVPILLDAGVKLGIYNKEGFSAAYWIRQNNIFEMMNIMGREISEAAENADVYVLKEKLGSSGTHFLSLRDSQKRNLLHKLMLIKNKSVLHSQNFVDFMKRILDMLPELICQTDDNGDTPVHVLAQNDTYHTEINMASEELEDKLTSPDYPLKPDSYKPYYESTCYRRYTYVSKPLAETNLLIKLIDLCNEAQAAAERKPWFLLNFQGNAPLHLAILSKNYQVAEHLATVTENSDTVANERKETGLHLLARLPIGSMDEKTSSSLIMRLKKGNPLLDNDGFTPVVRALAEGNFEFAKLLYSISMSVRGTDTEGLTLWHRLVKLPPLSYDFAESPFANKSGQEILKKVDKDGDTPLHLAIKSQRFDLAQVFLGLGRSSKDDGKPFFLRDLLDIRNNEGITPGELLGSLPYIPNEFEQFVWKNSTMIGIRSMWGIPTTGLTDYVNTMGVIAALLTTITFTAAFAVPGGFDQEKGTPLLIKDAAFQVFIISDILAMCLSMMVLFCLL